MTNHAWVPRGSVNVHVRQSTNQHVFLGGGLFKTRCNTCFPLQRYARRPSLLCALRNASVASYLNGDSEVREYPRERSTWYYDARIRLAPHTSDQRWLCRLLLLDQPIPTSSRTRLGALKVKKKNAAGGPQSCRPPEPVAGNFRAIYVGEK